MIEDFLSEKHKKKKKKRQQFVLIAVAAGVAIAVAFVAWFFVWSPIFRLEHVVVTGERTVSSTDIMAVLYKDAADHHGLTQVILGQKNILAWPNVIASGSFAAFPQIADMTIAKDYWGHTITATVTERQPFAIWCMMPPTDTNGDPEGDEACYWFDEYGTMFANAFDTEGNAIFAIHDYAQGNATGTSALGEAVLPDFFVPNLISILGVLRQSGLNIKDIALNDASLEEIDVSTYDGPEIYFSLRFPSDEDLPVLESLMAKPGFGVMQYIDFRVENRAYYK